VAKGSGLNQSIQEAMRGSPGVKVVEEYKEVR